MHSFDKTFTYILYFLYIVAFETSL